MEGFLNILKPPGMTSHDVVGLVRRQLGKKAKVGHLGTLDPAAAGVLPLAVGRATKLIPKLPDLGSAMKGYLGEIQLGVTTHSDDLEGEVVSRTPVGSFTQVQLGSVLAEFVGEISQIPPQVSAIRKDGVRAYQRVLRGQEVQLEPRRVSISALELCRMDPEVGRFTISVVCGPGTYIRALARDIGHRMGWGGALAFLLRTHSGPFHLEQSVSLEELLSKGIEHYLLDCEFPFTTSETGGEAIWA
ncbi:MAG: tRNA pseudouridine(55) synthase TruB [Vulcanimicrobiota bacterium]